MNSNINIYFIDMLLKMFLVIIFLIKITNLLNIKSYIFHLIFKLIIFTFFSRFKNLNNFKVTFF